ncbi:hypothetical protein DM298_04550 [Lactobacillus amylovorus]|uniref:Uncharacterized protein n=1 Tax=Lactobacillus amylovorus TaxID=1604 RepID=A0A5B8ECT2_LACAM|nr:hypothetical protein [Lactobacillus amylovorus]QDD70229.1 hypothetical protein DM298_04550 [Lactobacillus amylovorus]
MTVAQLNSYIFIIAVAVIAVATAVSAGCAVYIQKMKLAHKPVPQEVIDVKTKADWLVSEASTLLDASGVEKKDWATNQLQQTNPNLSDAEARGAIQSAYDKKQATQSQSTDSGGAVSLGTVDDDNDKG